MTRDTERGLATLFVNTNNEETEAEYTFVGMCDPVLYDPMDDEAYEINGCRCDDRIRVKLKLPPYRSIIIKER